jgi:hypothetical protein
VTWLHAPGTAPGRDRVTYDAAFVLDLEGDDVEAVFHG